MIGFVEADEAVAVAGMRGVEIQMFAGIAPASGTVFFEDLGGRDFRVAGICGGKGVLHQIRLPTRSDGQGFLHGR